jgi:hypothetical protein
MHHMVHGGEGGIRTLTEPRPPIDYTQLVDSKKRQRKGRNAEKGQNSSPRYTAGTRAEPSKEGFDYLQVSLTIFLSWL